MAEIMNEIQPKLDAAKEALRQLMEGGHKEEEVLSYGFVGQHPLILTLELGIDWNRHLDKIYRPVSSVRTCIVDPDMIDQWEIKGTGIWENDDCLAHNALMLCRSPLRDTGGVLAGTGEIVFSAIVVWVAKGQARTSVPDAIALLKHHKDASGVALCYIPSCRPYWPYLKDGQSHIMVWPAQTDGIAGVYCGVPNEFRAFEMVHYVAGAKDNVAYTALL